MINREITQSYRMNIKHCFLICCALAAVSCASDVATGEQDGARTGRPEEAADANSVKGWIRIKLSEENPLQLRTGSFTRGQLDSGDPALDALAAELGASEIRRVFGDGGKFAERRRRYGLHLWYDVRFDEEVPVSRACEEFSSLDGVRYVEPIYVKKSMAEATLPADAVYGGPIAVKDEMPFDDPMLPSQWHYHSDGSIRGCRTGSDMNLFEGWKTSAGDPAVVVAVTDSGVQFDHEDLQANMWVNEAELNGSPGIDDDGNGYIDDIYGWNYETMSGTIVPEKHGTHVAGTVAAVNNNGIGVCGVAGGSGNGDGARIMSLQIFMNEKSEGDNDADAYAYAADNGAVISQNSWTWTGVSQLPKSYSDAFDYFIENAGTDENGNQTGPMRGGIIICAAGNSGGPVEYPAADPRTFCVTAMGSEFNLEPYSNRGLTADIMAPGGVRDDYVMLQRRVLSTSVDNGYDSMYGTSMAAPHVAGMAALIVAHYGVGKEGFTPADCREILLRSYKPMGGLVEERYLDQIGVGMLDAGAAFVEDPGRSPEMITFPKAAAEGNIIKMSWIVPADANGNAVARFKVECYPVKGGTVVEETFRNFYQPGSRAEYAITGQYNTGYEINVSCIDRFGNVSAPVGFSVMVGDFDNRPPQRTSERLADVTMPDTSQESVTRLNLSQYFTDPDAEYGDILSYTAISSKAGVVGVEVEEDVLSLIPLAAGTSLITITASDIAGESVSTTMYATVVGGGEPVGTAGISVYPNPVEQELNIRLASVTQDDKVDITVYDAGARKVLTTSAAITANGCKLDVGRLAPGAYTLIAKYRGEVLHASFLKR